MGLSVVLPAYKEADNLKVLLPLLHETLSQSDIGEYEILVVDAQKDTGDGTKKLCLNNGVTHIYRENGPHYGDAIRTGIGRASKERLVIMDADGSHDPKDILRMNKVMNETGCDLVIGSRYTNGGKAENNWILLLMSRMVNIAYQLVLDIKVKDVSDSFRMYKTSQVKQLHLLSDNFDLVEEILVLLQVYFKPLKIIEIPIVFKKRLAGKSKRNLFLFVLSYVKTMWKLWWIKNNAENDQKRYS